MNPSDHSADPNGRAHTYQSAQYAQSPPSHYVDQTRNQPQSFASPVISPNQYHARPSTPTTPNQYYYPLRPLAPHNLNTSYSSPPIPLYSTGKNKQLPAGDQLTSDSASYRTPTAPIGDHRSEYLVDGGNGRDRTRHAASPHPTSITSQYYPHTNLMPVQQSSIPQPIPSPSPYTHQHLSHQHASPVPMQPLRPHNLPYPSVPLHHMAHSHAHNVVVPLVPRSSSTGRSSHYTRQTSERESSSRGQENLPPSSLPISPPSINNGDQRVASSTSSSATTPSRDCSGLSDKQLLRARFAQRGVLLDKAERIGSGRYSKVMTAGLKDGSTIAIKIINTTRVTTEFRTKFLPREIECWERLRHSHLIKLLHRDEIGGRVFLFMEFGPGGDMLAHVQKNGPVHEATASLWMRQIISGITYMHKLGLVHRDLKLENIIIFSPSTVKIADFGFARRMGNELSATYCGSKSYSAPEILSGQPYNPFKADVWSMGVIAYVIVTDRMPFKDSMPNAEIVNAQKRRLYSYPPQLGLSASCRHTIDSLLVFDAQTRPSIVDSARMPWFVMSPSPFSECPDHSSEPAPLDTVTVAAN